MKMAGNYEGGEPRGPFIFAYGNDRQILQYFEVDAENRVRNKDIIRICFSYVYVKLSIICDSIPLKIELVLISLIHSFTFPTRFQSNYGREKVSTSAALLERIC